MFERIKTPESQFGKEWLFFDNNHGLKVADLIDFQKTKPKGVLVLPGASIGVSWFKDFLKTNNLSGDIDEIDILNGKLPDALSSLNNKGVNGFDPDDLRFIKILNEESKNFLLVADIFLLYQLNLILENDC